jgi:hypothetical protein
MTLRAVLRHRLVLAAIALIAVACVISSSTRGHQLPSGPVTVESPIKAHLLDGSIVVYARGATISRTLISGDGMRYDPTLRHSVLVTSLPLDSVIGVESYEREVNPGRTLLYSTLATAATTVFSVAAAVAIFGSCPTIYADSAGTSTLQAESFSYSIAPLLEKRDVDRLQVAADSSGVVRLDVRNEALETHYIDQLVLLEARHAPDELVVPAARAGLVAIRRATPPASVHDRAGRDLHVQLDAADDRVFDTDSALLARAARGGLSEDHIDVVVPRPLGHDRLALVLRARSSLLTTMLFYDQMLSGQGASALDYVGTDLGRVTEVAQLANWYVRNVGLRVSVFAPDGTEQPVIRLVDFGPAAWRAVAAIVPVPASGDSVHVRLTFLADAFRIDQLLVSSEVRDVAARGVELARVVDSDGLTREDVRDVLRRADDRRLQTEPGQHFFIEYDVGKGRADERRTYFIAAQGHYSEWVRGSWLESSDSRKRFAPWDEPLAPLLQRWLLTRDSLENGFFRQRVPIV